MVIGVRDGTTNTIFYRYETNLLFFLISNQRSLISYQVITTDCVTGNQASVNLICSTCGSQCKFHMQTDEIRVVRFYACISWAEIQKTFVHKRALVSWKMITGRYNIVAPFKQFISYCGWINFCCAVDVTLCDKWTEPNWMRLRNDPPSMNRLKKLKYELRP